MLLESSGFCKDPALQSPGAKVSCRYAARRPALSMRALRWSSQRLQHLRFRCSGLPLPVTYVPPYATPSAVGVRKAARLAAVEDRKQD